MITFKRISYKNFLSTGNQPIVVDLNMSQTTLVVGTNGSGKSTLLDALCFVLFNRPFRTIKKGAAVNIEPSLKYGDEMGGHLITGHIDTVGVEGMDDPFTLKKEGDRLYGRGTYDMLSGCAIQMGLADYFSKHPCPITLVFSFVADEENLSIGMEHIVEHFIPTLPVKPFLGIFLEPNSH